MNERDSLREIVKTNLKPEMITVSEIYRLWVILEKILAAGGDHMKMKMNPVNDKVMSGLRTKGIERQLVQLKVTGPYFDNREAITFDFREGQRWVGFCGWASSPNEAPFVAGFKEWLEPFAPARSA